MSVVLATDCLDDIIGLSRSECECFDVPTNISLSGLYMDEIDGLDLNSINGAADCAQGSLFDLMRKAREQAIIGFKTDYTTTISNKWKMGRANFKGQIGNDKFSAAYTIGNVAGHRYVMAPIKNGVFKISRLGVLFNNTGTVNISIYSNLQDSALYTYNNVPTVAGKLTWYSLDAAIELPMYDAGKDYVEYFIVYDNPGFNPKANGFRCCSTTLSFSCSNPAFKNVNNDARFNYANWCEVTGVNGADIDTIRDATPSFNNNAMGLVVDGELRCNMRAIACNDLDFENGVIPKVIAYAVWYRACAYLAEAILSTGQLSRYTMLDRERLYGKRNEYRKAYNDRLDWLTNPDVDEVKTFLLDSGCVICDQRMFNRSTL